MTKHLYNTYTDFFSLKCYELLLRQFQLSKLMSKMLINAKGLKRISTTNQIQYFKDWLNNQKR